MTEKKITSVGGVPLAPEVYVKGGTMSGAQERLMKTAEEDAEQRRAQQDAQQQMALQQQGPGDIAAMRSRKLLAPDSPKLVLWYRKHDQDCLAEITMVSPHGGAPEPMFTLVCTRCLERGVPQGQAQLQVLSSNKKFSIDHTKRGPKMVEILGVNTLVQICGTVTVEEAIRCDHCGWRARIIDSKVEEV